MPISEKYEKIRDKLIEREKPDEDEDDEYEEEDPDDKEMNIL